jgi:hypothetical protein
LRRVIFALAMRTPSILFGSVFGCEVFFIFPADGIIGRVGVGIAEARSIGCVLIGPVVGLALGMIANALPPHSFNQTRPLPIWAATALWNENVFLVSQVAVWMPGAFLV